jgi:hypothetical protein
MAERLHTTEGCFIPKKEKLEALKHFRTISQLNIEGEIFLAMSAKRMTTYMLTKTYIDITVHKGGVLGVSECVNVQCPNSEQPRSTGSYGSIPHKLFQKTP